jgi:hypothetical protein
VNKKSPGRKRADAEFDRLWRPAPAPDAEPTPPPAETRPEKTERLKALRLDAERTGRKPS